MNSKKIFLSAVALLCSLCFASVTHAQQRLWGVSANGELFSMNADGSDVFSASSFGHEDFGFTVAGFSESVWQNAETPTNLVFTTRNSTDWAQREAYGKVVRIEPTGLKKSNAFREGHNAAAHGLTHGPYGAMFTPYVGDDHKWQGLLILAPGTPDGWYEGFEKPNADYSKEYYMINHDGVFYGVSRGDANSNGFIYKLPAEDYYMGIPEKIFFFNNTADGLRPTGRLSVGQDDQLFGYTLKGGAGNKGTFYKVNFDGNGFKKLFDLATKSLAKAESNGKYQTLLDAIVEGYVPVTDSEGNYLVHDATGIYRVAPTGYLISKISSINADRIAFITPRFQHHVKVSNIANGSTGIASNVALQVNEFTGANGYQLQLSTSSDFTSGVTTFESEDNIFTMNGLTNGTTFYTRARAKSWPYYGDVISFTCSEPVVDNTKLLFGGQPVFSMSTSGTDKIPFEYSYAPNSYTAKQLSNGDKLIVGYELEDDWYYTTLYKLTPDGLQKLYRLDYMDETEIESTVVEGDDGYIYSAGFSIMGAQFAGFFRFKLDGSSWETVHIDQPGLQRPTQLIKTPSGIYGNAWGRQTNLGFIYKMRDDFSGLDIIYQFTNSATEGARPEGKMVYHDGWIYGTARIAGANAAGTIFKVRPSGADYTVIHHFSATFGKNPMGLVLGSDGILYGATQTGAKHGKGIIYKINLDGTAFQKLYEYGTHVSAGESNIEGTLAVDDNYIYSHTKYGTTFRINKDGSGYLSLGASSSTIDLWPATATNAHVITPANLSENVHINADFVVSEIAGAAHYTVQYSTSSDFSNSSTLTSDTTVVTGLSLNAGTTYFVRVRTSLSPAWGQPTTFTTASPQSLSKVISPENGSVDIGTFNPDDEVNSPYLTITLQTIPGATYYTFQLSNDSIFTGGGFYEDNTYDGQTIFNADGTAPYYGQYIYARVRTNLSLDWGPVTKFRMIEYPTVPSECEYDAYPNPSDDSFTLNTLDGVNAVYVRDGIGILRYQNQNISSVESLQFGGDFPQGIYFMTIVTDSGERVVRLVKE